MLNVELDKVTGIATLMPGEALSENDFESARAELIAKNDQAVFGYWLTPFIRTLSIR